MWECPDFFQLEDRRFLVYGCRRTSDYLPKRRSFNTVSAVMAGRSAGSTLRRTAAGSGGDMPLPTFFVEASQKTRVGRHRDLA